MEREVAGPRCCELLAALALQRVQYVFALPDHGMFDVPARMASAFVMAILLVHVVEFLRSEQA